MKPELRVFVRESCVVNPPPAPAIAGGPETLAIAALFVPKLVEFAVGGLGSLLKKAGETETEQVSGSEIVSLFAADGQQQLAVNRRLGCILAVYGVFSSEHGSKTRADDAAVKALEREGLVPRDAGIAIVLELAVVRSDDDSAFHVETRHFSVRDFIGDRKKSERAYVATVSVTAPDATADGATLALGHVALGRVSKGETLSIPGGAALGAFPRYRSNLMPLAMSADAKAAYDSDVKRDAARNKAYMPVTVGLTLSETADGNKFLATLGTLLEGAKAEAGTQLAALIDPAARAKKAQEDADAAEKLWAAEEDALIAVREAEVALATGEPEQQPLLQAKLAKAKRALAGAERLRRAAGLGDLPAGP